jgi:hypothetical protein
MRRHPDVPRFQQRDEGYPIDMRPPQMKPSHLLVVAVLKLANPVKRVKLLQPFKRVVERVFAVVSRAVF